MPSRQVYNPGFEFAPAFTAVQTGSSTWIDGTAAGSGSYTNWGYFVGFLSGTCTCRFDTNQFNTGTTSMKLSTTATASQIQVMNSSQNTTSGEYIIQVLPNTQYTLTFWMKTVANSGSAATGAAVQEAEYSNSGTNNNYHFIGNIVTTTAWTQYTYTWTTNIQTTLLKLVLFVNGSDGTGTLIMDAWFDDFVLSSNPTSLNNYQSVKAGDGMSVAEKIR